MAKFVCTVCGYVHEGDAAPEKCPVCKVPAEKFNKQDEKMSWAAEHIIGVAEGAPEDIIMDLRANFEGECSLFLHSPLDKSEIRAIISKS